jgi:flagellar hook-associated protein 2
MDIKADTDALKEKVTSFVTAYNEIMDWILSGYEEFGGASEVPDQKEGSDEEILLGSVLRGDSTINSMKRQLQGVLTGSVKNSGDFHILSEIGITTNLNGTLKQDNSKLDEALENNYDDMVYLLSGDDETAGVMKGFNSLLLNLTSSTQGMYAGKKTAYDSSVKRFDTQIEQMELRMTKREQNLRRQFTAMEALVSSLNAQGDFLTQQMDALNRDS